MSHVAWGAAVSSEFLSKADTDASGAFAASLLLKGAQAKMSQGGRAVSEKPLAPLWDQPEAAPGNGKPLCISGGKVPEEPRGAEAFPLNTQGPAHTIKPGDSDGFHEHSK